MDLDELRRFPAFAGLTQPGLEAVACQARQVRLPPRRWLVQPGRHLRGQYFLLEGRVRLVDGSRQLEVAAGAARARQPVHPGIGGAARSAGVATLTRARFLFVDMASLALPWQQDDAPALPEVASGAACWQQAFLASPLLERLPPVAWQRILRAMTARSHQAGDAVIRFGEAAPCCYVLCSGRAEVLAPGCNSVLAVLAPGDLFGEDALITGGVRNASVRMSCAGATVALPADCFQRWLLDAVVVPLGEPGGRRLLHLGAPGPQGAGALPLPLAQVRRQASRLSRRHRYAITGGTARERALAAFLLAQQGVDARPLTQARVKREPCGPGPSS